MKFEPKSVSQFCGRFVLKKKKKKFFSYLLWWIDKRMVGEDKKQVKTPVQVLKINSVSESASIA